MNILVINGSPKGKYSTTLHTCLYLEKKYPEVHFEYINAGQKIKALEKDFSPALEAIGKADILLFCYPVYTFLVPSQLHRFVELMKESGVDFSNKIATQVSTSKHFYDITAHRFISDNCADMGIRHIEGLSADMDDLLTEKGQKQARDWFEMMLWRCNINDAKHIDSISVSYENTPSIESITESEGASVSVEKTGAKRIVIVADFGKDGEYKTLREMVEKYISLCPYECDLIDIQDFPFMGGCVSCFNCSTTGKCFYKDGFDEYLRGTIHKHDAIIYAFHIKDHSMGSRFKIYDDRQFCNGHRTVTMGTPFGYIIDGAISKEENLRLMLEARAQVGGNFLAGMACNENATDGSATNSSATSSSATGSAVGISIEVLNATMNYAIEHRLEPPQNFLGVGGMKIFRDLIYQMRGMMRADHKFFKSHGQYDFPQKKWKTSMLMYLVGWMMGNKKLKAKMGGKMSEGMISAYKKVVDEA